MRYRVPQNIDMEDKIIGPLTMAQFLSVMIGGMVIYVAFITLAVSAPWLFWLISIPVGLFTVVFSFMKVQDQPFPKFLTSVLLYLVRPKVRIWQKDALTSHLTVVTKKPSTPEQPSRPPEISAAQIDEFTTLLDQTGSQDQSVTPHSSAKPKE